MDLFIKFWTLKKNLLCLPVFRLILHPVLFLFLLFNFSIAYASEESQEFKQNFSTPKQTLDALVEAILKGDMPLYEQVLGRKLDEFELEHIESIKKAPENKIVEIKPVVVINREYRGKEKSKIFCITQDALFVFANGKQSMRKFETCFKKVQGRWLYLPQDIRLFQ